MKGERTKNYLDKLMDEKKIPYIDIIVKKEHKTLFRYYRAQNKEVTGKENLFLFSCTKPMTVASALRLVEEGEISLDDEVSKYLPAYADTFLKNGEKTANPITIRHLLTMMGGLSYQLPHSAKDLIENSKGTANTLDIVSQFAKEPLQREPGTCFEYSFCHDVLGAVIEVVTQKRFSAYMNETIFSPLDMANMGFHLDRKIEMAPMYQVSASGEIIEVPVHNELVFGENYDSGGAGVIGNVEGYAKFVDAMACGGVGENGYRILEQKTVDLLRQETTASLNVNNTFTCVQGDDYGYGLGVRIRKKATEWGLPVGEFGWDGAAGMYMMVDPIHKISVVIGMHLRGWPDVFMGEHLNLVRCAYEDMQEEKIL